MPDSGFVCERPDILDRMREQHWFIKIVEEAYQGPVFQDFGLQPELAIERITQAFKLSMKDLPRIEKYEYDAGKLDHFKQAGIIAYWLRRTSPIIKLKKANPTGTVYGFSPPLTENFVMEAANEIAAFHLGYRVCRYIETFRKNPHPSWSNIQIQGGSVFVTPRKLTNFHIDVALLFDAAYVMMHKNVSPHAIGLIYRSLFTNVLKTTI